MAIGKRLRNSSLFRTLVRLRKLIICIGVPLLCLPLALSDSQKYRLCFVLVVPLVYLATDSLPVGVTFLLPCVLLPVLHLQPAHVIASYFGSTFSLHYIGVLMCSAAIQTVGLHKRIATFFLSKSSGKLWSVQWMYFAITCAITLWTSSMATMYCLMCVIKSMLESLEEEYDKEINHLLKTNEITETSDMFPQQNGVDKNGNLKGNNSNKYREEKSILDFDEELEMTARQADFESGKIRLQSFGKSLTVCVWSAAKICSMGTPMGSGFNILMMAYVQEFYDSIGEENPLTFLTWMAVFLPTGIIIGVVVAIYLQLYYQWNSCCRTSESVSSTQEEKFRVWATTESANVGKIRFEEVVVIVAYVLLILSWFFKKPGFMDGWTSLDTEGFIHVFVPTLMILISLFIVPNLSKNVKGFQAYPTILDWSTAQNNFPWAIILMIGSGMAVYQATREVGLLDDFVMMLKPLEQLHPWLQLWILLLVIVFATEVLSDIVMVTLIIPTVGKMAINQGINPMYLILPCGMMCTQSYLLPTNPLNVIVVEFKRVTRWDLLKSGLAMNIITATVMVLTTNTFTVLVFPMGDTIGSIGNLTSSVINATASP